VTGVDVGLGVRLGAVAKLNVVCGVAIVLEEDTMVAVGFEVKVDTRVVVMVV
jgi:hypothetical protein